MANAPKATTGASFRSSRRFRLLNRRSSIRRVMEHSTKDKIQLECDSGVEERLHATRRCCHTVALLMRFWLRVPFLWTCRRGLLLTVRAELFEEYCISHLRESLLVVAHE